MKHINRIAEENINKYLKALNIYDDLYNNKDVTEVMINTNKSIFVKKLNVGFIEKEEISDNNHLTNLLKILSTLDNKQLTELNPNVDTELILSNGQKVRIAGIIPPNVKNPTINIRKHSSFIISLEKYLEMGYLNEETYNICLNAIKEHKNILVIGGTDTGKTTFVNALLQKIEDMKERIIIIEDVEELKYHFKNNNRVKTDKKNFTPVKALKYCMRASPERIIFGEVRDGAAAYELVSGLNSGHPGGITTIHANDSLGGLKKLEMYINAVTSKPISEEIGLAIDILINIKIHNFKRYLASIDICTGYDRTRNQYILENLYSYVDDETLIREKNIKDKLLKYIESTKKVDSFIIDILKNRSILEIEDYILRRL